MQLVLCRMYRSVLSIMDWIHHTRVIASSEMNMQVFRIHQVCFCLHLNVSACCGLQEVKPASRRRVLTQPELLDTPLQD